MRVFDSIVESAKQVEEFGGSLGLCQFLQVVHKNSQIFFETGLLVESLHDLPYLCAYFIQVVTMLIKDMKFLHERRI